MGNPGGAINPMAMIAEFWQMMTREDWGGDMRAQPLFLKGPKLSQIKRDHA